jgi:dTDP-4-dehydrorhamnose reductase
MLGNDLRPVLARGHEVVGTDLPELDLAETEPALAFLDDTAPDLIVHAAAWTDVDGCEENPEKAFRANLLGTWNVATAAARRDVPVLYLSTGYVFDGERAQPYREFDHPAPINVYGESKYAGEQTVQHLCRRHFIVRTSGLFGYHGRSFPASMLRLGAERRRLTVVDDERASFTYTRDLAEAIGELIESSLYGIYHVTNGGADSWCGMARTLFAIAQMEVEVEAVATADYRRGQGIKTRRPRHNELDDLAWRLAGHRPLRSYEEALGAFVNELRAEGEAK